MAQRCKSKCRRSKSHFANSSCCSLQSFLCLCRVPEIKVLLWKLATETNRLSMPQGKIELCTDKTDFRFYFVAPFPHYLPFLFQAATSSLLALSHVYKGGFLLACIINKSNAAFFYFQKVFHSPRLQLLNTVRGTTEQRRTLTHSSICMTHTH